MNTNEFQSQNVRDYRLHYQDPYVVNNMTEHILGWFPSFPREYVVVCIGTDRSTGDALGPLVGTYLHEYNLKHMSIYGTLHEPVHAKNMHDAIDNIYNRHRHPFIIAIDACLGKSYSVGKIITGQGSLKPGAALNKKLPDIGDVFLTGVVNVSGFMDYTVLQNTRLSVVNDMAKKIAQIIQHIDVHLVFSHSMRAIVSRETILKTKSE